MSPGAAKVPRAWLAAILSLLLPGTGQAYCGKFQRGVAWAAGLAFFLLLWNEFSVFSAIFLVGGGFVLLAILGASAVDAAMQAWSITRAGGAMAPAARRWMTVGAILLVSVGLAGLVSWISPAATYRIDSNHMAPTLFENDRLMVNLRTGGGVRARGDIVAFRDPRDPKIVRFGRVAGLPGDLIKIRGEEFQLNAKVIPSEPSPESWWETPAGKQMKLLMDRQGIPELRVFTEKMDGRRYTIVRVPSRYEVSNHETEVPPGAVFILGDHREYAYDSRYWGALPVANVIGRVVFVYQSAPEGEESLRFVFDRRFE